MRLSFRTLLDFDFAFGAWETHISVLRHGLGEASALRKMSVPSWQTRLWAGSKA
jgi:hypothetical protein